MKKTETEQKVYTEYETEQFLKKYLPVARSTLCKKPRQAQEFSRSIGFPLVLKIISTQALHKSDIRGVRIIASKENLQDEFTDLLKISKKKKLKLDGILVQEFVKGQEVIIGLKSDPTFGHVIMFGLGGVFVEVLKDVAFRVCPITEKDAEAMLKEIKTRDILYGVRGEPGVNIPLLKQVLVGTSRLPLRKPEIQELDINPFRINDKDGKVADARMICEEK